MIKLEDLTPSIYYKESRDFQLIGRLFDLVLNFNKTSADTIYYLPHGLNVDSQFATLMAMTLGFKPKHHYNSTQLNAICNVLPIILKNKGSLKAIILAANALLKAEGITESLDYEYDPEKAELTVYLPVQLNDTILLEDLLDYIVPAGLTVQLVKEVRIETNTLTELALINSVIISKQDGKNLSILAQTADLDTSAKAELEEDTKAIVHGSILNLVTKAFSSEDEDEPNSEDEDESNSEDNTENNS